MIHGFFAVGIGQNNLRTEVGFVKHPGVSERLAGSLGHASEEQFRNRNVPGERLEVPDFFFFFPDTGIGIN